MRKLAVTRRFGDLADQRGEQRGVLQKETKRTKRVMARLAREVYSPPIHSSFPSFPFVHTPPLQGNAGSKLRGSMNGTEGILQKETKRTKRVMARLAREVYSPPIHSSFPSFPFVHTPPLQGNAGPKLRGSTNGTEGIYRRKQRERSGGWSNHGAPFQIPF